ncbi:MAG: hypothetical protein H0U82_11545 [Actinobacteria bacterium]|nr:hypothetical protein [Actinomycetota bacterium]
MSRLKTRLLPLGTVLVLALVGLFVLAVPTSSGQVLPPLPTASVTICQVTGSASAPNFLEVQVTVDQIAAYLNQYPGSFLGSCPAPGGGPSGGGGNPPLNGAVTVCRVSGSASAPILSEVLVAVDQVAVFLNQNPGSFVGACPASSGGGNAGGSTGGSGPLNAVVTVCRVTGAVNAPDIVQLTLNVDQVVAFLNQNPGSFIGTCPGQGGTVTQGPGRILGIPLGAALTICQVTASAKALRFLQVNVAIDRVAAFLNQNPGSFVGLCPSSGDPNGTIGHEPLGYVTICRVTGNVDSPLAAITLRLEQLRAYLARAGTVVPGPTGGCPAPRRDGGGQGPPATTQPGRASTVVVQTTPNTVVTAIGAGVNTSTKSNTKGTAKVKVKPKRKGIIVVRADGGRVVQRVGVVAPSRSGGNLTG